MTDLTRRDFIAAAGAAGASLAATRAFSADRERAPVYAAIDRQHDEGVARLQAWIRQPSIAAEQRGVEEGCALTMSMLRDAGFGQVVRMPTDGCPGIFATLDAGAKRTVGLYFMYDVKQVDPQEWNSPPWEARLVDLPELGRAIVGRGAVNQKGPQAAFIAALHAFKASGRRLPVNLVLVAEGEEEIGSPHFGQVVNAPEPQARLRGCDGVFMPSASQDRDGSVTITLGAKGVIECELVASGEKWGRGPSKTVHSSLRARLDSPAFHLVQALNSLVTPEGEPAIDGLWDRARPVSPAEKKMLDVAAQRLDEDTQKRAYGAKQWARNASFRQSLEDMVSRPTVNIEGLVGGYTGPGGMTILPHRAAAKLDLRLVPDMTHADTVAKLRAHLAKRGFGDIDVNVTGGYDPTTTSADALLVKAQAGVYRAAGIDPLYWPRAGGSWPGYLFTNPPLSLAAGHFGLGHGQGAHAPNEYYLIESRNPKLHGWNEIVRSFVDYLYALA